MWGAGLEDTLLERDSITLDDNIIQVGTPEAKRAAFSLIAAAWDGLQAAKCYADFCVRNGVDASELHRKHAISWDMLEELRNDARVEILKA
jgi:hypothetical protein